MKIAYFTDQYWPSISGVSVSIDSFRKQLCKMGHEVYVFVPNYPGAKELDEKRSYNNIFRFKSYKLFFNDENRLVYRWEKKNVFKVLDSINPDIIHVQTEFAMGKIASSYAKRNSIPLVMTAHTNWEELIHLYIPFIPVKVARLYCRYFMRKTYNKADVVIVPTSLMELLLNLYFVKKPIRVIPTGIDKEDFEMSNNKYNKSESLLFIQYPQLKGRQILFFAGRIGREKNITFLIDVLEKMLPANKNLMLVISGDGPARKEIQEYTVEKGIENHVIFTGFVERKKLKEFYSVADVFVFASKVESQGMVTLESMACGTPVVAIGKMGTREVMGGDSGGFMVDDELAMFVEKTELLLSNPEIHKSKSIEAVKHVENWTIQIAATKMLRLYKSLVQKRNE
jgi:glycosyltransferase involved in cell wall biosynthesis